MKTCRLSSVSLVCCAMASSAFVLGCYGYATASGPGPAVVEDDYVVVEPPPRIETYPAYVYAGAPHYYVGGRWYWRSPRGWVYYRREPPELARHRPGPVQEERREDRREDRRDDRR